jgi:hypothetical protein
MPTECAVYTKLEVACVKSEMNVNACSLHAGYAGTLVEMKSPRRPWAMGGIVTAASGREEIMARLTAV